MAPVVEVTFNDQGSETQAFPRFSASPPPARDWGGAEAEPAALVTFLHKGSFTISARK